MKYTLVCSTEPVHLASTIQRFRNGVLLEIRLTSTVPDPAPKDAGDSKDMR